MSELVIKTAKENGDLPKDFDGQETKLEPITLGDCKIELKDVFNPTTLREWFEKVNGQENKEKDVPLTSSVPFNEWKDWHKMKLEFTEQEIKDIMLEIDMSYSGGGFSSITQEIIAKKIKEELKKNKTWHLFRVPI